MNKEIKSKLTRSYIYEDEVDLHLDDYIEDEKNDKEDNNNLDDARLLDPLIVNEINRNSNHSNRSSRGKFTGENVEDKLMLYDMGFKSQLINTIYDNIHPINISEALDYLNKNDKGKFTHSYIENERFVCSICNQGRYAHENTALFVENNNQINNTGSNTGSTPGNNNNNEIGINLINNNTNNNNLNNNNLNNNINNNLNTGQNRSSSERYNRFESSYLNSLNKNKYNYDYYYSKPKECIICGDKIEVPDTYKIKLSCGHDFCVGCWEIYLTDKINNSNVAKISCMQHGCSVVLSKDFIKKLLDNNDAIIKKYEKFLERQTLLMSNKNVKFCPFPDCDGYAEKKDDKYVKCNFGHNFCFECLKNPHGTKKCEEIIDADFEEWKKHKIVKRCPNCKIWTEKNEGCNHMTCVECQFQWCWLCQKKYEYGHYNAGSCKGLQFEKEQDEEKIKKLLERNLKKYPPPKPPKPPKCQCLKTAIKKFLLFIFFLFFSPYFFFFRLADDYYYLFFFPYVASFIVIFIAFEVFFFSFNIITFLPGLLFRKYRNFYNLVQEPFN